MHDFMVFDGVERYCNDRSVHITVPDDVTKIDFMVCERCESLTIGDNVTVIEGEVFSGMCDLAAFHVSPGNEHFCSVDGVLYNKDRTKLICYPPNKGETTITIPDGVEEIVDWAFCNLSQMACITIPDSVAKIGSVAFYDARHIERFKVSKGNKHFCSLFGVLYNKERTKLIRYPAGKTAAAFIVPDGVREIGDWALFDCTHLLKVVLSQSVESIGFCAFSSCSQLVEMTIPDGVKSIDESAFSECLSLVIVTLPASVTSIAKDAFDACYRIRIFAPAGTYAETYAKNLDIRFHLDSTS